MARDLRTGAGAVAADPGPGKAATGPAAADRPWGIYVLRVLFLLTILRAFGALVDTDREVTGPTDRIVAAVALSGAAVCATLALVGWAVTVGPPGRR